MNVKSGMWKIVLAGVLSAVLLAVVAAVLHSGAFSALTHRRACERALSEAWVAVASYGRGGTVEEKHLANAVISNRIAPKGKKRSAPTMGKSAWCHRLRQVRRNSPDPQHPDGPLTVAERDILEIVNEPLREESVAAAKSLARDAMRLAVPESRRKAIDRLAGMGEAALPGIAMFLSDGDSAVFRAAARHFVAGLRAVEDDRETAALAKLGMLATDDPAILNDVAVSLVMCADQRVALLAAIDVMGTGRPAQAAAAQEAYGSITGEDWTDRASAEAWMRDNCEQEDADAPTPDASILKNVKKRRK